MDSSEPTQFQLRRTPDVNERSFVVFVPGTSLKPATQTPYGVAYQDFALPVRERVAEGWGSYILTDTVDAPPGYLGFSFARPKTEAQRLTPFRTRTVREPYPWPDWLVSLYGWVPTDAPIEVMTADGPTYIERVIDRPQIIDGRNYESEILIEEFLSPEPFPASDLDSETPQPTTVFYNFLGAEMQLHCLHDDVRVPEQHPNGRQLDGFGTPGARPGPQGDFFPATNFKGWAPHRFSNRPEFIAESGVWYRMQKTVTPLYIPKARHNE